MYSGLFQNQFDGGRREALQLKLSVCGGRRMLYSKYISIIDLF